MIVFELACVSFSVVLFFFFLMIRRPPRSTLFPYTTPLPTSGERLGQAGRRHLASLMDELAVIEPSGPRSEEHTSELQSRPHLVCRLLLEKKKQQTQLPLPVKKKKQTQKV